MTEDVRPTMQDSWEESSISDMETSYDTLDGSQDEPSPTAAATPLPQPPDMDPSRTDAKRLSVEPTTTRSRPISEIVNDAFQDSPATNQFGPEFINMISEQVTNEVLKRLAHQQATASTSATSVTSMPSESINSTLLHRPRSATEVSTDSSHQVFTPTDPDLPDRDDRRLRSPSPDRPPSDSGSHFSYESRGSTKSVKSERGGDEVPRTMKKESTSTIRQQGSDGLSSALGQTGTGSETAQTSQRARRDSKTSEATIDGTSRAPAKSVETLSDDGETPLERIWQPLFLNGNPTPRLGQFLRGLALHLIDDYEPRCSLVVTPPKMLRFFNDTKVEEEYYPWDIIFGGKMAPPSVSHMYRSLVCEHHLIQTHRQEYPTIPGLTPHGFEWFMTCLIQAHPDKEYERLAKAVMNMPISNADKKSERFPKNLPRRLFPAESNIQAEQRLISSLVHEPYVLREVKSTTSMPPPPATAPAPAPAPAPPLQRPQQDSFGQRERQSYPQAPQHSNVIDDEDLNAAALPIERERKPYTGREGTGRVYPSEESRPTPNQHRSEQNNARPTRLHPGPPPPAFYTSSHAPSEPVNIPPRMPRRQSTTQGSIPSLGTSSSHSKPVRGRSSPPPPPRYASARNGPELSDLGSMPNSHFGTNLQPVQSSPTAFDTDDDPSRRFQGRTRMDRPFNNNMTNEDTSGARNIPIPNRNPPSTNAYFEYNSLGGPVGGPPPIGSSYPANRSMPPPPNNIDDRRRSMFAAPSGFQGGGDGGTDGYGSFANGMNGLYPQSSQQSYGSSAQH